MNSLCKGFIRSAVNQVGRDYGRTISNQIFGDSHATPVRVVKTDRSNILWAPGQPNKENEIEYHKQDIINWQDVACLMLSPLMILIGPIVYGIFTLIYLFKDTTAFTVYTNEPRRIPDRRYSVGYRVVPQGVHKERIEIPNYLLDSKTIAKGKIRVGVWAIATVITTVVNVLLIKYGMK